MDETLEAYFHEQAKLICEKLKLVYGEAVTVNLDTLICAAYCLRDAERMTFTPANTTIAGPV